MRRKTVSLECRMDVIEILSRYLEENMTKYSLYSIHLILAVVPGVMLQMPDKCGTADTSPMHSYVIGFSQGLSCKLTSLEMKQVS